MHELSIAISMIELAEEELAQQGGGRIETIYLRLGPLSGVVKEALLGAFEMAREESANVSTARLVIEDVPAEINCPKCKRPQPVESIQEMRCRVCGTPSADVVRGRELEIRAMEICDSDPNDRENCDASTAAIS